MNSDHTYLTVIGLDSVLNKDESYYPQVIFKESKYIKKSFSRHIIVDLESSSDDSYEEQIKAMKVIFFEKAILKKKFSNRFFLREKFQKCPLFEEAT